MYKASIENRGDTKYLATTRHGSFAMDTSGRDSSPVDALLAALCACLGHYVHDFLRDEGIPSERFTVSAEATAAPDRSRLAGIAVRVDLGETRLDAAREGALLRVVERCIVHGTLRQACPVEVGLDRRAA